jgi:DNA-directed RNA polymerase subunit K/omega
MVSRPISINRFEFVRLSALRTSQLVRGCAPRVSASGKLTTTAQHEVAKGMVCGLPRSRDGKPVPEDR